MKIPERTFWDSDISFLDRLIINKSAYNGWFSHITEKESERKRGK